MPLRETQADVEVYQTGGETFKVTQADIEAYYTGGETFKVTQADIEVYSTVEETGATQITRYIHTGSTAGGDGTTAATTGAHRAWPSLNHALGELNTAYGSGLVVANVQVDLICQGSTDDTTTLSNPWPADDATRYIHLMVPVADRKLIWDANVYTYNRSVNFASALIITTGHTRLTGIQVEHSGNLNVGGNSGVFVTASSGVSVMDGVKVAKANNAGAVGFLYIGFAGTIVNRNCVVGQLVFGASSFGWTAGLQSASTPSDTTVLVYNLTTVNNVNGGGALSITIAFVGGATNAVVRLKNILAQVTNNDISVTNATTDDRATNVHSTGTTASFVAAATGNLRLTGADTVARNQGTDLSGVADWPFSIDVDQNARPFGGAWDIGAHENYTAVLQGRVRAAARLTGRIFVRPVAAVLRATSRLFGALITRFGRRRHVWVSS